MGFVSFVRVCIALMVAAGCGRVGFDPASYDAGGDAVSRVALLGECGSERVVTVHWRDHCVLDEGFEGEAGTPLEVGHVPAGSYVVTALPSGGSFYAPEDRSPPETGWRYMIPCPDLGLSGLRTPWPTHYASAEEAYDSLATTTEIITFEGGMLTCRIVDAACGDNEGETTFVLARSCAP